jgi:diadenosine tetraphosphate (Ap4A) HIT family hydrolase
MDAIKFNIDPRLKETSHRLIELKISELRLVDDARWPWLLVIPRVPLAVELIDVSPELRCQIWLEIEHVSQVMQDVFSPYKLNVAALGNQVRQLHVHVIARFSDDDAWPNPVWGVGAPVAYEPSVLGARLKALRRAFA